MKSISWSEILNEARMNIPFPSFFGGKKSEQLTTGYGVHCKLRKWIVKHDKVIVQIV